MQRQPNPNARWNPSSTTTPQPAAATDRRIGDERLRIGLVLGQPVAENDSEIADGLQLDERTVRKWRMRCL